MPYSTTTSVPRGLWLKLDCLPQKGDFVQVPIDAFSSTEWVPPEYFRKNIWGENKPFLKRVAGLHGDTVELADNGIILINSVPFPNSAPLSHDRAGRFLRAFTLPVTLASDEVWLLSDSPLGFDSRYLGIATLSHDFEVRTEKKCSSMLLQVIYHLYKRNGHVVVLIDEYDKPILDNLEDLKKAGEMREVLRSFYVILKSCDEYLRFVMLTGISKFSRAGVFSALNNLQDISMIERYGDITGYTQNELEVNFSDWIDETAQRMLLDKIELVKKIREYYDGFSFDGKVRLYNPFSILNFFSDGKFGNYWYVSGSPTFIVNYMKRNAIQDPEEYRHIKVSSGFADAHEIEKSLPESFLYQSGYLTIEKWVDDEITLDYPNEEVRKSILRMYLDEIYHVNKYMTLGTQIWEALSGGNIETVVELYNTALSGIPYDDFPNRNEFWYRSLFLMLLRGAGIISYAEVHTYKGQADIVIQLKSRIIVLEFKFAKNSSEICSKKIEGEQQIRDRDYFKNYDVEDRQILVEVIVANDEIRQAVI